MERTLKGDIESVDSPEMSLKKHQNNFSSNPNVRRLNPKFNPSINSNDEFKPDATNFRNLDNSFNSDNLIKEHPSDEERDNSREESPNLKIIKPQLALAMSSSTETINRILNKDMPKDDIYFYGNPDTPKLQFEPSGMYSEESKGIEGKESSEEVKFEAIKYNEKPRAPERFGEKLRDYLKLYTNEKKKDRSDLVMSGPNPTPLMDERFRYQDDDQSIHNIQSEEEEATNNINVSGINAYTINSRKS